MSNASTGECRNSAGRIATWGKRALIAAALAALLAMPIGARAAECPAAPNLPSSDGSQPANLGVLKLQLLDYKCFGAYDRDVAVVLAEAQAYVEKRADPAAKLALVLDIDETSLSNWPNLLADDFGFFLDGTCDHLPKGPCGSDAWIARQAAEAIRPTLDLFNAAKARSVSVFFITGRGEAQRAATMNNLKAAGYDGWADLIMKQAADKSPVRTFKTMSRKQIEGRGFTIIANVGDQYSDLDGGHAERTFKVPNPFYFIP